MLYVTSVPYQFGHSSRVRSTLWKRNTDLNSDLYDGMIIKSQEVLFGKLLVFLQTKNMTVSLKLKSFLGFN